MSEVIRFRHMNAQMQIAVGNTYAKLLPRLLRKGLLLQDAVALAYNVTFLYYALDVSPPIASPYLVLARFSLKEIAELCALYVEHSESKSEYFKVSWWDSEHEVDL